MVVKGSMEIVKPLLAHIWVDEADIRVIPQLCSDPQEVELALPVGFHLLDLAKGDRPGHTQVLDGTRAKPDRFEVEHHDFCGGEATEHLVAFLDPPDDFGRGLGLGLDELRG